MSTNHFSTDLPDTVWWTPPPPPPPQQQTLIMEPPPQSPLISQLYHPPQQLGKSPFHFNLNQHDDESHSDDRQNDEALVDQNSNNNKIGSELRDNVNIMIQKEAMFEKPLTPSDVGKLNRLVIPKQHAEKYFPIGGTGNIGGGGDSVEKGLLSFEDESGKSWRFRYSYWNSSQSYVLTKGWSRFVKEKRLDAGDVVMFERQVNDNERFFIGWRRRNAVQQTMGEVAVAAGGGWARMVYAGHPYPPPVLPNMQQQQYTAATAGLGAGGGNMQNQTRGSGHSKTVRLFGVNLECQSDEADGTTQAQAHYHPYSTPHLQNHMDTNFSRDVNQMRFHQG